MSKFNTVNLDNHVGDEEIYEDIKEDIREEGLYCEDLCDDDFEISNFGGVNQEDDEFDNIVSCLQDCLIDPDFEKLQQTFIEKNCEIFEDVEENKHEYFVAFKEYKKIVEGYLDNKLKSEIPAYSQKRFVKLLEGREDQIDEQIIDTLTGFDDFMAFKELMMEQKLYIMSKTQKESIKDSICFEKLIADTNGYENMDELEMSLNVKGCL